MKITKCKLDNDHQALGILKKSSNGLTVYDVLRELQKYLTHDSLSIFEKLTKNGSCSQIKPK